MKHLIRFKDYGNGRNTTVHRRALPTKEEREFAEKVIREAVRAAEQIFNLGGQGEKKYAFVIEYITTNYKLKLSAEEIEVIIEAAVNELKSNKEKI